MNLVDRQDLHARCGQLDRERNAVEPPTDLGDRRRVVLVYSEIGQREPRMIDEKADRLGPQHLIEVGGRGQRQRAHHEDLFTLHAERFAAGRDDLERAAFFEERVDRFNGGIDHVLAAV